MTGQREGSARTSAPVELCIPSEPAELAQLEVARPGKNAHTAAQQVRA